MFFCFENTASRVLRFPETYRIGGKVDGVIERLARLTTGLRLADASVRRRRAIVYIDVRGALKGDLVLLQSLSFTANGPWSGIG